MDLKMIRKEFAICKVKEFPKDLLQHKYVFTGRSDDENSIICETDLVPDDCITIDSGWYCFRIAEDASFEKYGMIAYLANIIAAQKTSTLVVGTYDTDYIFIKKEKMNVVKEALIADGCRFLNE